MPRADMYPRNSQPEPTEPVPSLMDGKYDSAFKTIIASGWANKSDGDVEAPTVGYFALITITEAELPELVEACDLEDFDLTGAFVTMENSDGIIYVWQYQNGPAAMRAYDRCEKVYAAWAADDDDDDD